jgi:hypothetical protein
MGMPRTSLKFGVLARAAGLIVAVIGIAVSVIRVGYVESQLPQLLGIGD